MELVGLSSNFLVLLYQLVSYCSSISYSGPHMPINPINKIPIIHHLSMGCLFLCCTEHVGCSHVAMEIVTPIKTKQLNGKAGELRKDNKQ
jgi:hypothetical protein